MRQQEQFEADYLAAFPFVYPADIRQMEECNSAGFVRTKTLWLQQAKRHEAEIAELMAALKRVVDTPPAFIDGQFIVEHHDIDGEFLGAQPVDPVAVVQEMQSIAYGAIEKYEVKS